MALVYITCRDKKEAKKISMHLLKKRLAACANIFPIKSMYWWKGKIVDENESAIIAKTIEKNFEKVVREVKRIHSYEIPCILRINAAANKEYEDWANKEIGIRTKKKGMNWTEQGLRAMLNIVLKRYFLPKERRNYKEVMMHMAKEVVKT